ncbi:MAG: hypothetical protein LBU87_06410 [Lactobacillales bacterium]|jgi:hypothetical protein|nr:hypothetical protein [Lactobacillales bacterium]
MKKNAMGIIEKFCPNCGIELDKFPKAKTKCKECKKNIYKRTCPLTDQNILIREDQIDSVEEEWSKKNGFHDSFLERKEEFSRAEEELKNLRKTTYVVKNDIHWYLLNKKSNEALASKDFFKLWSIENEKAKILISEGRLIDAIHCIIQASYFRVFEGVKRFSEDKNKINEKLIKAAVLRYLCDCLEKKDMGIIGLRDIFDDTTLPFGIEDELPKEYAWFFILKDLKWWNEILIHSDPIPKWRTEIKSQDFTHKKKNTP